jgi:hypothetical protein
VQVRKSNVHGYGTFASRRFAGGEVVVVWGGTVFTGGQIERGEAREHSYGPISGGLFLGTPLDQPAQPDARMNHSCDPNVWLLGDDATIVARRDIRAGQELTIDYATFNLPGFVSQWQCNCQARICRGRATGGDLKSPDLRAKYGEHVMSFLLGERSVTGE